MPARGLALLLPVLLLSLRPAWAETTFGPTQAIPKQENPTGGDRPACGPTPGTTGSHPHPDEDEDEDEDGGSEDGIGELYFDRFDVRQGLAGTCFALRLHPKGLGSLGAALILFPMWWASCSAVYAAVDGPVHVGFGNRGIDASELHAWRVSWGLNAGGAWIPGASGGMDLGLHVEATGPLSGNGALELRVRGAASAAAEGMDVDYARAVFEDGKPAGMEIDSKIGYSVGAYPITAELLWHPGDKGFYLGAGGGALLRRETLTLDRSSPVPGRNGAFTFDRDLWVPTAVGVLGREGLRASGRPRWYFEIRLQSELLRPSRTSSFPSDNAGSAFSVGWVWGWYL